MKAMRQQSPKQAAPKIGNLAKEATTLASSQPQPKDISKRSKRYQNKNV